jgi:hypothetical protein
MDDAERYYHVCMNIRWAIAEPEWAMQNPRVDWKLGHNPNNAIAGASK